MRGRGEGCWGWEGEEGQGEELEAAGMIPVGAWCGEEGYAARWGQRQCSGRRALGNQGELCPLVGRCVGLFHLHTGAGLLAVAACECAAWSFLVPVSFFQTCLRVRTPDYGPWLFCEALG